MSSGNQTFLIGKVSATHGVRGQLRITSFSGDMDSFMALRSVMIKKPGGGMETLAVAEAKAHGKKIILSLKGYTDINDVLHLVGREIYVLRDQLPLLSDGEYYWCDLLGLQVMTEDGDILGELVDIISTGSNDVYVVHGGGDKEILIPALDDVVLDVDTVAGRMTVSLPEGLLDL
ncbi:16S rRNA processing protein RimM [Geotalea daltonii FRC-32]|uniref:Ribosome maturation factor RimM n=1 Tax=Geotalea daltonii (strain DSM 22248 / JCM 15807 / FRC-32) TaxID=316067 RepID=RIMM_GEODF|nr:ribosome maturation factor RimM [Geotalea daltonii]B9M593.1 RecName: Full=Ribosome maturation factor RimM [Geotalea daltonii FRC-32]ACM19848.1 16S rRNA processing protein RimM [Geotalea daltonii FRC-32]